MLKKILCLSVVCFAMLTTGAQAIHVLEVDLSVTDMVTITGTGQPSAADASGSSFTGAYFEDFYGGIGAGIVDGGGVGDLTNAENPSDGSPGIFRALDDPGLNIWAWSSDGTVTFTAGSPAFTGTGTWALDPADYANMLSGNSGGDVYFPADTVDDVGGAVLLGRYAVVVPEPSGLAIISLLAIGLFFIRRR